MLNILFPVGWAVRKGLLVVIVLLQWQSRAYPFELPAHIGMHDAAVEIRAHRSTRLGPVHQVAWCGFLG